MTHQEHVHLIKQAISTKGGVWADLGSGEGAFTLALRDLAGADVEIYSIDTDAKRLQEQQQVFARQFPGTQIHFLEKDFTNPLELPPLDGILMANSLHYVREHELFLSKLKKYLKPKGKLVLIEYSIDEGQPPWVPYPLSFSTFEKVAQEAGFTNVRLLEKIPSTYWDEMYCAAAEMS